jgi:MoaA/NifB/PqqE/SkfB family radical SAM enzyme
MRGSTLDKTCPGVEHQELSIEVTTRCNSSCLHCFARSGLSRPSSLPVKLVKEILDEGYDIGYRHLHITGGEPLLWKGLFEILDYGFNTGYGSILINTNGTLITDEISKRLADYGSLFSMSISLDGPEELHDRMRGNGSYEKALKGIEKALDRGNNLIIFTTVTKSLLPELPYFIDGLYRKFPAISQIILIQLICVTNSDFPLSEDLLAPEDFVHLVKMVALLNVGSLQTIIKKNPVANLVSKLLNTPWIPQVPPLYREGCIFIMANRNIGVVHSIRNNFGKYKQGMIRKVLASEAYRRTVGPDQDTCPRCKYVQLCRENGMIRPLQGYGDFNNNSSFCKQALDAVTSCREVLGGKAARREGHVFC